MSEALQKAQAAMRAKREAGIEIERLDPIEKARRNPKSLRLAINAKCWDCCCEQRMEIKHCAVKNCPLWALRPYQEKTE